MKKKLYSLFLFIAIFAILPTNVLAEELTFGKVQDDLTKAQNELNANNQAIQNKEDQIDVNNATINSLKNQITAMGKEADDLQKEIVDANAEIESKNVQSQEVIAYLQMSQGENAYLEYIFGGDSIKDLIYRLSVVEQITEYNDKIITDMENLITKNENRKKELAQKQEEYEKKTVDLNNEIGKLNSSIASLGELSPSLEQQVKSKKELVDYYKSQGCKNRTDVIGRDCAVTQSNATFLRPMTSGYVTSFVGYRWGSLHRGIDLGSSTGRNTPLYSIGNGVITSVYHDSYGALCLIIQYKTTSGQYYSALYAHLSRYGPGIYVGMKAKEVTSNTIVGYMGDTGHAFGVHLHLEVYPCRLYGDNNCSTWNKYVSFATSKFKSGYKGASSVISFPSKTYQTWYSR